MKIKKIFFLESEFIIYKKVLLPRPETEQMVDLVIKNFIELFPYKNKILEIGCGSGVISISLFKKNKNLEIDAVDISELALKNTIENCKILNAKLNVYKSDMFKNVKGKFDLIIANLPYVKNSFVLSKDVLDWDPSNALFGGDDGLKFFRYFLKEVKFFLKSKFLIALEIGYDQKEIIKKLIKKYLINFNFEFKKDYSGKYRFVFIYKF